MFNIVIYMLTETGVDQHKYEYGHKTVFTAYILQSCARQRHLIQELAFLCKRR